MGPTKTDWAVYALAAATIVVGGWNLTPTAQAIYSCCLGDGDCYDPEGPPRYCDNFNLDMSCTSPWFIPQGYYCKDL